MAKTRIDSFGASKVQCTAFALVTLTRYDSIFSASTDAEFASQDITSEIGKKREFDSIGACDF